MTLKATILTLLIAGCAAASPQDGAQVYKANCTRCHITMRPFSEKMTRTIVRHMRVRAELTQTEADAVLSYLLETVAPASAKRAALATK
jgi:hypothetical protein